MKNKLLYLALLMIGFSYTSCNKISESIERDIIIADTSYFEIPVLTNLATPIVIPNIKVLLNADEQIKNQAREFSTANVRSVKIARLGMGVMVANIDSIATDSVYIKNNFANLESVTLGVTVDGKIENMGSVSIPSSAVTRSLTLTTSIRPETLRAFLFSDEKRYTVTVKAKKTTAEIIRVGVIAVYAITVSK